MAKFLANVFLVVAQFAVSLGNYWFTFGLWPQSWASFALFFALTMVLLVMGVALKSED